PRAGQPPPPGAGREPARGARDLQGGAARGGGGPEDLRRARHAPGHRDHRSPGRPPPMTWTFSPARSGMAALAAEWDDLNRRVCRAHPFLDTAFVGPLVDCFAGADDTLAVYRGPGGVEAMLLLQAPRRGICSTFLPSQAQIAPTLLPAPGPLGELVSARP